MPLAFPWELGSRFFTLFSLNEHILIALQASPQAFLLVALVGLLINRPLSTRPFIFFIVGSVLGAAILQDLIATIGFFAVGVLTIVAFYQRSFWERAALEVLALTGVRVLFMAIWRHSQLGMLRTRQSIQKRTE